MMGRNDPKNLRVLHVTARADSGGGPEHIRLLLAGRPTGFRAVACPSEGRYRQVFNEMLGNENLVTIPHRRLSFAAIRHLRSEIRRLEISVVHSHGRGAGILARIASLGLPVRNVHTFHGLHTAEHGRLGGLAFVLTERVLLPVTDALVAVSASERSEARRLRIRSTRKMVTICNGIEVPTEIRVCEAARLGRVVRIVAVARNNAQKNCEMLAEVYHGLIARGWDVELTVLGDVADSAVASLSRGTESASRSWVSCPGVVASITPMLRQADVFLSTSRWEGLPLAVLEAMGEGVPLVLSDVVGHVDLADGGRTAKLFPISGVNAAVDAVIAVMDDPADATTMTSAAFELLLARHSADAMREQLESLYLSLQGVTA